MKRTIKTLLATGVIALGLFAGASAAHAHFPHEVVLGDWVSKIAASHGTTTDALVAANPHIAANPDLIYPGQLIHGPSSGSTAAPAAVSTPSPAQVAPQANSGRYVPYGEVLGGYYAYGGTGAGGGFDCSGLTQYLARRMGFSISRSSYSQQYDGRGITRGELWPGDLVIMNGAGHVAMYIGNGNIVHALNPSQGILVQNLDYAAQWMPVVAYRALGH